MNNNDARTIFRYYINSKKPSPFFESPLYKSRCTYTTKKGRCKRECVIGYEECRQHLVIDKHLKIKKSNITKAGLGVFSSNKTTDNNVVFEQGEYICDFHGEHIDAHELYERYLQHLAPYAMELKDHSYLDGATKRGIGSLINVSMNKNLSNVNFHISDDKIEVYATKNIRNNEELLAYIRDMHGRNANPYGGRNDLNKKGVHYSTRRYANTTKSKGRYAASISSPVVDDDIDASFSLEKATLTPTGDEDYHATTHHHHHDYTPMVDNHHIATPLSPLITTRKRRTKKTTKKVAIVTAPEQILTKYADEYTSLDDLKHLLNSNVPIQEIKKLFYKKKNVNIIRPSRRQEAMHQLILKYNPPSSQPSQPSQPPQRKIRIEAAPPKILTKQQREDRIKTSLLLQPPPPTTPLTIYKRNPKVREQIDELIRYGVDENKILEVYKGVDPAVAHKSTRIRNVINKLKEEAYNKRK
jgi:hypothetical protein